MEQIGTKHIEYLVIDDDRAEVLFNFTATGGVEALEIAAELGYSDYDLFVKVQNS